MPFDDLPEHSPLTNSATTLTPTPSTLYPQIQNSPDLLLQILTHPQIQNSISWFITTGREKILSTLSHFSPFSSITNPERKTQKSHKNTRKKKKNPRKIQKKCRNSVIREDRTKNFNKFLLSLSHSFSPLLFLFRFQFSLHFLCSQTSTGAITEG